MYFTIKGDIQSVEKIASGNSIRELKRLQKYYGKGKWRKMKGNAIIVMQNKSEFFAEIHWYEAHGIGKKEFKIKRILS